MSVDTQKPCPLPCHTCPDPDTELGAAHADRPPLCPSAPHRLPDLKGKGPGKVGYSRGQGANLG